MGLPDNSLLSFIDKIKSWWIGRSDPTAFTCGYTMASCICNCELSLRDSFLKHQCKNCTRILCGNCMKDCGVLDGNILIRVDSEKKPQGLITIGSCKFCSDLSTLPKSGLRYSDKIYPDKSPRGGPDPQSPSCSGEGYDYDSPHAVSVSSIALYPSPVSVPRSPSRSDEDDRDDSNCNLSDIETSSVRSRLDYHNLRSVESSPFDSPSGTRSASILAEHNVQQEQQAGHRSQNVGLFHNQIMPEFRGSENSAPADGFGDHMSIFQEQYARTHKPLDFESNGPIWFPPPAEDENEDRDINFFTYDDDDDEIGDLRSSFSSIGNVDAREPLKAMVHGHFQVLVSQLLQGEGVMFGRENDAADWLDIVSTIAWQAANFVKPNTSRGGSMDPVDYIKIKCVASGVPRDSILVKGVVCTKNIKHKRMTSQHKHPKLLLLGGALEFKGVANQLESFDVLRQKEMDHLKMMVSNIEALRTNVLLVEKSVSSYAQEYLLAKDISLVLNIKRSLLERIARCTGARISPSVDKISTAQLGHCECFRLEKFHEEHEPVNQLNKKPSKTLMFFEGCPRHLGCTVLLKGSCREVLKKVKHVVQYAVFAAYHLSLETSFLADEGASLPKFRIKPSITEDHDLGFNVTCISKECKYNPDSCNASCAHLTSDIGLDQVFAVNNHHPEDHFLDDLTKHESHSMEIVEAAKLGETETSLECYQSGDTSQSILVSFSSRCILNESVCERSRLHRIKFYGSSDKPLGRYLQDDLFDQISSCQSCKEPTEAHVLCYTHKQGNLTINVRRLPYVKLPRERDGKIWMWHRCLRCAHVDSIPPATRRVVMSDAAWGLSFGKFLELSFSNHTTANRVANCGHSLQRDCLRYYGYGSMIAFFRYSPIDILNVCLPPPILDFDISGQEWIIKEAAEFLRKAEALYAELSAVLRSIDRKVSSSAHEFSTDVTVLHNHVLELNDLLTKEKCSYHDVLEIAAFDILELNRLRHSLLICSHVWDRRFNLLESLLSMRSGVKSSKDTAAFHVEKDNRNETRINKSCFEQYFEEHLSDGSEVRFSPIKDVKCDQELNHTMQYGSNLSESVEDKTKEDILAEGGGSKFIPEMLERAPSAASVLSDTIDSVWTGSGNPSVRRLMAPTRVYSFDSAQRLQERIKKGFPPSSMHLSMMKSFHASGDFRSMSRDPIFIVQRSISQISLNEPEWDVLRSASPSFLSSASLLSDGARLMTTQNSQSDVVIAVYDNEPSSIISYALSSKDYEDWVTYGISNESTTINMENRAVSDLASWQSFGSLDLDYIHYKSNESEDSFSSRVGSFYVDQKTSPHLKISFMDESSKIVGGKVKFSVTCYLAKQFDDLRKKCCPTELDFIRSLSRCKRWSAEGGKSNVYFARSLDERFIIKQVTKTELESFVEFAPEYFKYLTDSLNSGSPTCLAKVLGIYQVTLKYLKGGKETKMDLMVMENLFFKRKISRVYDLKGSARSRYVPDATGKNKVLLDLNLLETLRTKPIFLGSHAKRRLERAVWNDTSFLAAIDVMDYSLLVGVDDEKKELVLGIIDFMRQYTWDKHLETWVKACGILGGGLKNNASPTIISPEQYKKRFRKAMTTYFLTVPDQWSS